MPNKYDTSIVEAARIEWESTGNVAQTARKVGVSEKCVRQWRAQWITDPNEPLARVSKQDYDIIEDRLVNSTRVAKRAEVVTIAWDLAAAAFKHAMKELPNASAQQAAIIAGIAVDKAQLLEGRATEIVQNDIRAIVGVLPNDLKQEIIQLADSDLRRGGN